MCQCGNYNSSLWHYPACGKQNNVCKNTIAAHRHKRDCHTRKIITENRTNDDHVTEMQDTEIQDYVEHDLDFDLGFGDMSEVDVKELNFLSYLNMQIDVVYKNFIKNLKENDVKKCLVARLQGKQVS